MFPLCFSISVSSRGARGPCWAHETNSLPPLRPESNWAETCVSHSDPVERRSGSSEIDAATAVRARRNCGVGINPSVPHAIHRRREQGGDHWVVVVRLEMVDEGVALALVRLALLAPTARRAPPRAGVLDPMAVVARLGKPPMHPMAAVVAWLELDLQEGSARGLCGPSVLREVSAGRWRPLQIHQPPLRRQDEPSRHCPPPAAATAAPSVDVCVFPKLRWIFCKRAW